MLVLTQSTGQTIHIGDDIQVMVVSIRKSPNGNHVKLGITAPTSVTILRDEVKQRIAAGEPIKRIRDDLDLRNSVERIDQ